MFERFFLLLFFIIDLFLSFVNFYSFQVLSGITDPELDVLDTFEDVEYERRTIEVSLMVCRAESSRKYPMSRNLHYAFQLGAMKWRFI